jgi:type I restriction enzyme, S subunit
VTAARLDASMCPWPKGLHTDWIAIQLKWLVQLVNEKTTATERPYLGLENLESWTGRLVEAAADAACEGQSSLFESGDVLFGKLRPYLAKAHRASDAGRCTSELLVLRPRKLTGEYLRYLILAEPFISIVNSSTFGARMPRADWKFIGRVVMPCPPVSAQRAIADFLDRKTAAIDALIARMERLVELLHDRRRARITEVVTKGLNPGASLVHSGDRRLGMVPRHWKKMRSNFFMRPYGGLAPEAVTEDENGIDYFKVDDLNEGEGLGVRRAARKVSPRGLRVLNPEAVLIPKRGAAIFTNKVRVAEVPCVFDSNVMGIAVERGNNPRFIAYALWARGLVDVADVSTIPQVNNKHLHDLLFVLPPVSEQPDIVAFLAEFEDAMRTTVQRVEEQVERLYEYRRALITAAVTGQLDVAAREEEAA